MVRLVGPEDRDRVIVLAQAFLTEAGYPTDISLARAPVEVDLVMSNEDGLGLVLERPVKDSLFGTPVVQGFIGGLIKPHPIHGESTYFELAWYVTPEYRKGRGGYKLLQEAERLALERGAVWMQLSALDAHVGGFLERTGYSARETTYLKRLDEAA